MAYADCDVGVDAVRGLHSDHSFWLAAIACQRGNSSLPEAITYAIVRTRSN
jgi:hypothetical protein